jgi:hypothetical protein
MPSPGQSTFDGNPNLQVPTTQGYRPGDGDFDGAAFQNLSGTAGTPNPTVIPSANLFNTFCKQLESCSRMIPFASVSVLGGGAPSIAFWRVAANLITSGSGTSGSPFTVTRNSVGNLSIIYPAGIFPGPMAQPDGALNLVLGAHNYSIGFVNITNGVQVTTTQDGVLTDLSFTVNMS